MNASASAKWNPIIIGICGGKRHGKDTAAQAAKELGFVQVSFAAALKRSCAQAFGRPEEEFFNDDLKNHPFPDYPGWTYRKVLQYVGTELFRNNFPGIWINTFESYCVNNNLNKVVVSDMRFPDEFTAIRTHPNSYTIRISRPNVEEPHDTHESEAHYKRFPVDVELVNDRGPSALVGFTREVILARFPELKISK